MLTGIGLRVMHGYIAKKKTKTYISGVRLERKAFVNALDVLTYAGALLLKKAVYQDASGPSLSRVIIRIRVDIAAYVGLPVLQRLL